MSAWDIGLVMLYKTIYYLSLLPNNAHDGRDG